MDASLGVGTAAPPTPATSLVGRERDIAAVAALFHEAGARLVTLTGPGGVGKTRLALGASDAVGGRFPDGVVFVDLTPVRDSALVLPAVARSLGVRLDGSRTPLDAVSTAVGARAMLLVLDNVEQIVSGMTPFGAMLAACPRLALLVTSRVVLRLSGEHVFPVLPLALPGPDLSVPAERLAGAPAVRLFAERARAVEPGFAVTPANAVAVASICRRLDGLPLAIELAAAWSAVLPPSALLPRLARRLPLLVDGPRDLPARQQTLRDAIAWSYDLLEPSEQWLFRRLAVFLGGFSLDGAEAVAGTDAGLTLKGIAALAAKSLLVRIDEEAGVPRYAMLETVREFGIEALATEDDEDAVRAAQADHALAIAELAAPELTGPSQRRWLGLLEAEHANLRQALSRYIERSEAEPALRLCAALGEFWLRHSHYAELLESVELTIDLPGAQSPSAAQVAALVAAAQAADWAGAASRGATHALHALASAQAVGSRFLLATAHCALCSNALDRGELAEAERNGQRSYAEAVEVGAYSVAAYAINVCGVVRYAQSDYAGAERNFLEALELARRASDLHLQRGIVSDLGHVAMIRGALADSVAWIEQSFAWDDVLVNRFNAAWCIACLAGVAAQMGDAAQSALLFGAAAAQMERIGAAFRPSVAERYEPITARIRTTLGEGAFNEAQGAGHAMSLPDAIDAALAFVRWFRANPPPPRPPAEAGLTPRELEILRLLVRRQTDREIAEALFLSPRTVGSHTAHILAKLGVGSRRDAAAIAERDGLV
jgi:non-specific serine/threonine protein kinase